MALWEEYQVVLSGVVKNGYNVGNIITNALEEQEYIIGYILGRASAASVFDIVNCYYLEKSSYSAVGSKEQGRTEVGEITSKAELLRKLNEENNVWKDDTTGINNGYPILNWQ